MSEGGCCRGGGEQKKESSGCCRSQPAVTEPSDSGCCRSSPSSSKADGGCCRSSKRLEVKLEGFAEAVRLFVSPSEGKEGHVTGLNSVLLALHSGKETVLSLVTMLGDSLTSKDELIRARGTLLLSEVLARLPSLALKPNDWQFLVEFFTVRLLDTVVIPEVVLGLRSLVKRLPDQSGDDQDCVEQQADDNDDGDQKPSAGDQLSLHDELMVNMLCSLFDNVHTQSQRQSTRQAIFELLFVASEKSRAAVRRLKSQFAYGLIQAIDGEKDPRCLILAFKLVTFAVRWVPGTLRFVDELFDVICVYFPIGFAARDGNPITPQLLAAALDEALCSHAAMARLAVPFLLERFATADGDTAAQQASLDTLLLCCQRHGHNPVSPYFEQLWATAKRALLTADADAQIKMVAAHLRGVVAALSDLHDAAPVRKLVDLIVADCVRVLFEQTPVDPVTLSVFSRVLSYSIASASTAACQRLLVVLMPALVNQLTNTTTAAAADNNNNEEEEEAAVSVLAELLDSIACRYTGEAAAPLLAEHSETAYGLLAQRLDAQLPAVHGAVALANAGTLSEQQRRELVLSLTSLMLGSSGRRPSIKLGCLKGLLALAERHAALLVQLCLPAVFELDPLVDGDWQETVLGTLGGQPQLFDGILSFVLATQRDAALEQIVQRTTAAEQPLPAALVTAVALPLLRAAVDGSGPLPRDSARHRVVATIVRAADASQQRPLLDVVTAALHSGRTAATPLLLTLLAAVRRDAAAAAVDRSAVEALFALGASDEEQLASALAALANKLPAERLAADVLPRVEQLDAAARPLLFASVTQALYARGVQPAAARLFDRLLAAVGGSDDEEAVTRAFEQAFGVRQHDADWQTHPLYRQRLFCHAVPQLRALFDTAAERQSRALRCLAAVLAGTPRAVLVSELSSLTPVLLLSLQAPDRPAPVLLAALAALRAVESPQLLAEQLPSLVARLLPLATAAAAMQVRIEALAAIERLTVLPYAALYPHRHAVDKALEKALDDKKRLVRRAASQCRCAWLLVHQ